MDERGPRFIRGDYGGRVLATAVLIVAAGAISLAVVVVAMWVTYG